jgi:hypothetical protein
LGHGAVILWDINILGILIQAQAAKTASGVEMPGCNTLFKLCDISLHLLVAPNTNATLIKIGSSFVWQTLVDSHA